MQTDIEFFRREYRKQKKLEEIVNSRVLDRPNVKKWQVITSFVILPFLLFSPILFYFFLQVDLYLKLLLTVIIELYVFEFYLRFCLILVVKCYQSLAKRETRRRCKCIPSCSEYAILSLKTIFPLILAIIKIRKRLYKTCDGGDFKIDFPTKKMNDIYESKLKY